ncbi:MAG: ABC transporter ATP-binding protein [Planctomycetota bacterium]|nr:MAG: ABC transporter ATP-binding protein [Planctomycetota bacterium]
MDTAAAPLVRVENLHTHFFTDEGVVKAVQGVSFEIPRGRTLALVGESGCGKSVTALSLMRLVSAPGKIVDGKITFFDETDGEIDITALPERELRKIRGKKIAMIFQEPMTSLNPVFTVGAQIVEALRLHTDLSAAEARDAAIEMLAKVGIPDPAQRFREYPHQFSGGMRQRAMIAMALSCRPQLLIADEPTTALDVTIQAQILELLRDLQQEHHMSILLITHDLGIVAETAQDVVVMYASKIVEQASVDEVFGRPLHPYTRGLLRSRPSLGQSKSEKLETIEGMVPSPREFPPGCKFHPRCKHRQARCEREEPELVEIEPGHFARCHFADELADA